MWQLPNDQTDNVNTNWLTRRQRGDDDKTRVMNVAFLSISWFSHMRGEKTGMQSIHNSQLICLHSLISYLSPAKALLKQSRVVYKVCARIAHLYPVPLTLAPKNELPWYIKLINQKWSLTPAGIDNNCQLISTTFRRSNIIYNIHVWEMRMHIYVCMS